MNTKKANRDVPALARVLERRWNQEIKFLPDHYVPPSLSEKDKAELDVAVSEVSKWNESDPFAAGRMRLHLSRGLENPYDVRKEYAQRNLARAYAKAKGQREGNQHETNSFDN